MNRNYIKQFSAVVLGLFLMGMTNVFGQNISNTPTNHNLTLDNKLYEHGYNKDNETTPALSGEDPDMVTVGSTMPYFVMPDKIYNPDYYNQTDYKRTDLTKSKFDWTLSTANGAITPQATNSTGTGYSPWVKIKWGVIGTVKIAVIESQDASCAGDPTEINVEVIQKPEIMFSGDKLSECVPDLSAHTTHSFLVIPASGSKISELSEAEVIYDITYTTTSGSSSSETNQKATVAVNGATGTFTLAGTIKDTQYGTYSITIKSVSDKVSRKCSSPTDLKFEDGNYSYTLGSQTTFVYTMLPKPQSGKVYHIPNNL